MVIIIYLKPYGCLKYLKPYNHLYEEELTRAVEYTNCTSTPGYDTKQSDDEVPVMLEFWGMWSTPLLPPLPCPLWPRVVAPDKGPIYGLNQTRLWFHEFTVFCI